MVLCGKNVIDSVYHFNFMTYTSHINAEISSINEFSLHKQVL